MEFENILKLIDSVSNSGLSSFTLEEGGTKIVLEAARGNVTVVEAPTGVNSAVNGTAPTAERLQDTAMEASAGNIIKSPLVGVFYNSPSPEAEPFVQAGDHVKKGQVVGIIEAMKLMNEVEADADGVVEEIFIENGQTVEYGQPIFRIV
jgi:acetyl-CoA carboxylase biotin carboxyl carrier protein